MPVLTSINKGIAEVSLIFWRYFGTISEVFSPTPDVAPATGLFMSAILRRFAVIALLGPMTCAGCNRGPAASPPPAAAEKPKVESELGRTTLSQEAARSLGIRSEPARNETIQAYLALTGWVMAKPGNEVTLTAPVAGYVREPAA